jgi:hypothetical protein
MNDVQYLSEGGVSSVAVGYIQIKNSSVPRLASVALKKLVPKIQIATYLTKNIEYCS